MAKKVVTFGEIMLRLAPEGYYRFVQADTLGATYGGGEANVAVSLANYGFDAYYVTKLPTHEIGQAAVNSLRRFGNRRTGSVIDHLRRPLGSALFKEIDSYPLAASCNIIRIHAESSQ